MRSVVGKKSQAMKVLVSAPKIEALKTPLLTLKFLGPPSPSLKTLA